MVIRSESPSSERIREAVLVASGDLRLSANQVCWPAQESMERSLQNAFKQIGVQIRRDHTYNPDLKHGFIDSQRMGMNVFEAIDPDAPLIVAEAVWQYSHHVLAGLRDHQGPILTVANWNGQWPGLVGLLNLNGSLTKANVPYSTLWSETFQDEFFVNGIREWAATGKVTHDSHHVHDFDLSQVNGSDAKLARALAHNLKRRKAILGVFDEGCMGMYNAIIEDELLNPLGVYKERLSQSALLAEMRRVGDEEARGVHRWLEDRGLTFVTGSDPSVDLTDKQIQEQCKMYIAAVRMAHAFGCDAIGIQYQQGLKDMVPASDLAEGLLNNTQRPPVYHARTGDELYPGRPLPHFNEVDEGAGLDALITNHVWTSLGLEPDTTLHDIRWGEHYRGEDIDDFVWVFLISGAAPASHFIDGYKGASSERQPTMYFPLGGGTLKGVSKPGEIVWSRIFIMGGRLHTDLGRASIVQLPDEETQRRWRATTPQWPIMHAVLRGISRDQMMARHKANHLNIAYAPTSALADRALAVKAAMLDALGIQVHLCGDIAA